MKSCLLQEGWVQHWDCAEEPVPGEQIMASSPESKKMTRVSMKGGLHWCLRRSSGNASAVSPVSAWVEVCGYLVGFGGKKINKCKTLPHGGCSAQHPCLRDAWLVSAGCRSHAWCGAGHVDSSMGTVLGAECETLGSQWEVACCHLRLPAQAALLEVRMTPVARSSPCVGPKKKGPKAVLVNTKDACSRLWSGSMLPTISALP